MRYISKKPIEKEDSPPPIDQPISSKLKENVTKLEELLSGCSDAVMKQFSFGTEKTAEAFLVYFDGLVDRKEVEEHVLKSLTLELGMLEKDQLENTNILELLQERLVSICELKTLKSMQDISDHISSGDTVMLINGYDTGLVMGTRAWQGRGIQTPDNEVVIFGPKEGFCETLRFNTAMLRRRLKSSNFKMEHMTLGRITKTDVIIGYINGIAPPALVEEVKKRLGKIDIDGVLDTGYLEEFIADNRNTIFSQFEYTEKPDRVCGNLLEGHVCIMVDGSPMVMVLPVSFPRYWTSQEDYYTHYIPASLFRLLRFAAFWLALLLPSLYVAVITYHHEMIPTALLLTIVSTRQGVPFPAFVEALLLELTFEMLREAGLRLPRAVGPAVSIVGALIIGDAAVRAGLVSTPMVVVVAFTGIASFVTPSYNAGVIVRIARFGFLISSALLGFLGIMIALILMITRMVSLSSFGLPYMAPVAPFNLNQITDVMVRRPWPRSLYRPYLEGMADTVRQSQTDEKGE